MTEYEYGQLSNLYGRLNSLSTQVVSLTSCVKNLECSVNTCCNQTGDGGGTTPDPTCCDLQGTTDMGNSTTNPMYSSGSVIAITNISNILLSSLGSRSTGGSLNIKDKNSSNVATFASENLTLSRTLLAPDGNGILTLSATVNGGDPILADVNGNIDLGTIAVSTPNLQQVTDIGNTTTHNLIVNSTAISTLGAGQLAISNAAGSFSATIKSTNVTAARAIELPNLAGILAISATVNGGSTIFANTSGNIDLGDIKPKFTQGSVIFAGSDSNLSQDNSKFFWNDSSFRLGIGTATPSANLHVEAGSFLVNNGNGSIQFGSFAVNNGTNGSSVNISAVANAGYSRTIVIDQPSASMTFKSGNTEVTGAGFTRSSGASNLSGFTIFSGRTQDNSFNPRPGSIIFQTGDASAALVTNVVIDNVLGVSFNTIPAATNTKILYIDPSTKYISYGDAPAGGGAGTTSFTLTVDSSGSGDASGFTFDGSAAKTISYNSIGAVPTARTVSTTSPLSGGGDLSANRTIAIADAAADGTTKGAATFVAADFNAASGVISIDYTNGQAASVSNKGFLTTADWTTFNSKQAALVSATNIKTINGVSILGSGDLVVSGGGGTWGSITGTLSNQTDLNSALSAKQATLVSGTNIKTINSTSLLGSGNISTVIDESYHVISYASTVTVDYNVGRNFFIGTLTNNITIAVSNPVAGRLIQLRFVQGNTGSYTATFPAGTKMPLGQGTSNVMNLTTTVGSEDWVNLWYDGTNYRACLVPNFV